MDDDVHNQDRRFRLKGWHLILAAIVLLVGAVGLYVAFHRGGTERRIEALRAAGYPTTFAELAEHTKLPEGAENAAEVYLQAFAAFVLPAAEANVPVLGSKAAWPDRGASLPEPMARDIAACLAANRKCLALLREAGGIEHCRYDRDYRQMLSPAQEIRYGAQLLNVAAIYHAGQGDAAAGMTYLRDGLRLGDSLQREPVLIGHLVRIACIGLALNGLERSLSLTAFTEPQLNEMEAALARTAGSLDLARVLVTERCFMIEMCRDPSLGQSVPVRMFPGMRSTWLTDTLDHMDARIEACALPLVERLRRFRQIDNEIQQLSFLHVMTKTAAPGIGRVGELDARTRAHLDLARTALAIERYRMATGSVPQELPQLLPQYLPQVPIDPFDGQPIRYRRTPPGYLLYSVDTDGQDHGGRERSEKDRGAPYDWCFIVTR
jgi:hypothetical protein